MFAFLCPAGLTLLVWSFNRRAYKMCPGRDKVHSYLRSASHLRTKRITTKETKGKKEEGKKKNKAP